MRAGIARSLAASLAALLLAVAPATAQTEVHFGPMAGASFANFHGADVSNTKQRAGFVVGGFVRIAASGPLQIEPQLLYVQKGAEADVGGGITGTFKLDYVQIPVLIKAAFPVASDTRIVPSLFAGPALAFKVGCKVKASDGSATVEETCADAGASIKSTDFSFIFGGGADIGPIAFQLRYDLGLSKIEDASQPSDVKNKAWLFTVGYRF
jgi:hypothetical protein